MTSDLVGYTRDLPWMADVFGPANTIRVPICLACFATQGAAHIEPLTRHEVEAQCAALRAEGMSNMGGCDTCWTCGKHLLTGKRDRGFRVIQPGEQMDIIPQAERDAEWHLTRSVGEFYCPSCRDYEFEPACVKRYHAELDPDGALARSYPGWTEKGWLAWFQCDNCAWNRYKPVFEKKVAEWGRTLGGWVLRGSEDAP